MDNVKLYDFLVSARKPMSIGEINATAEFSEFSRQELAQGLQQLASENIAFRSVRQGKAYYSANPEDGVSRNPCQQNLHNIASALNHGLAASQNPDMAKAGNLFQAMDALFKEEETEGCEPFAFQYQEGITAQCQDYSISIPDGFRLEMGMNGRDFVAWLPSEDSDSQEEARITLYAGQLNNQEAFAAMEDHMKDPELLAHMIQATQWSMKAQTDQLLGISETGDIPRIAEVGGSYLYNTKNYQIMLGFPGGIKQMRVLIGDPGVTRETYHQTVVDWIATLKLKNGFPVPAVLDSDDFLPLTSDHLKAWSTHVTQAFIRVGGIQNMEIQARIKQHQYEQQYGGGSITLLRKDIQAIAEKTIRSTEMLCETIAAFVNRACNADPDNSLLLDLYDEAAEYLGNLHLELNLDQQPIKVASSRKEELAGMLKTPPITLLLNAREQQEAKKRALEEEARRREEEERKRKAEEQARLEALRKAEEEKRRQEELERRRIEEEKQRVEQKRLEALRRQREEEERIAAEKAAAERRAAEESEARERAEQKRLRKMRFLKKLKVTMIILLIIAVLVGALAILTPTVILPAIERARTYKTAQEYLSSGQYDAARDSFRELGNYRDSAEQALAAQYQKAAYLLSNAQYPEAIALWKELADYSDSILRAAQVLDAWRGPDYTEASSQMEQGAYLEAAALFDTLDGYKDSTKKAEECRLLHTEHLYSQALEEKQSGNYSVAMSIFDQLGDYQNSDQLYLECAYSYGTVLMENQDYENAVKHFNIAEGYQDAKQKKQEAEYQHGRALLDAGKYADAITQLNKNKNYEDSAQLILDAKFNYVQTNLSQSNSNTASYLKDLITAKYDGAQALYDKLYTWKVEIVAFNNSSYNQVNQNRLSKYQGMYCHFKVTGGEPGKRINLRAHITAPNGQTGNIYFNNCTDNSIWSTCFTYDNPYYGATGTMSVRIYNADTGKEMARGSVSITN